jgi:hypothetical protein
MIYLVICLIVIIVILRWASPVRYAVHASRVHPLEEGVQAEGRWMLAGFVYDEDGKPFDTAGKFIGHTVGSSMTCYNIPSGCTFIGDELTSEAQKLALENGDIVVVDGPTEFSETGLRLRAVDAINSDGTVNFLPDGYGRRPRPRPLSELRILVTHVVDNGRVGNNEWIASLRRRIFPRWHGEHEHRDAA